METGDLARALKDFSKAIDLEPTFALAYVNRARVLIRLGRFKEARKDAEKAEKLGYHKKL